jgi:hypothetical protein
MVTPPPEAPHIPPTSVNSEIKSDNPVLLATRADFDDLCDAQMPYYALACSSVLVSLDSASSLDIPNVATNSFAGQRPTSSVDPTLPVPSTPSTTPREGTTTPAAPSTTGGAPLTDGETTFDVLKFSTPYAIIEPLLVDPILDFSLSRDTLLDFPCDKDDLFDNVSVVHALKPHTCADIKHAILISNTIDELELSFSLHTLGYIEFDVLCNLDCLEKILSKYTNLPWISKHTYHAIDKHTNEEHYIIHRVYICSNMNSPFVVQDCDRLEGNHHTTTFPCSSRSFVLSKMVDFQEGKHHWFLPSILAFSFFDTNLLQDGVEVQCVPSDHEGCMLAEFFMQDDTLENWKRGFVLLHNDSSSICFRNPVLLYASQDWFQVQSTPWTAFRQEGEDDADMETMLMSMHGAWIGEDGVQQGFPSQEGGPRLIRFESPTSRPKAIHVLAQFGVREQGAIKWMPKLHTESVLGVLYMVGSRTS